MDDHREPQCHAATAQCDDVSFAWAIDGKRFLVPHACYTDDTTSYAINRTERASGDSERNRRVAEGARVAVCQIRFSKLSGKRIDPVALSGEPSQFADSHRRGTISQVQDRVHARRSRLAFFGFRTTTLDIT